MKNDTTIPAPDERAELKPCPFCGGRAKTVPRRNWGYCVECQYCDLAMPCYRPDFNFAIADWNTRTPPQVKALVWHKSHMRPWDGDYHTFPTCYNIRCANENGYLWTALGVGAHGYSHTPEAAMAAAQADYTRRILDALT